MCSDILSMYTVRHGLCSETSYETTFIYKAALQAAAVRVPSSPTCFRVSSVNTKPGSSGRLLCLTDGQSGDETGKRGNVFGLRPRRRSP